MRSEAIKMTNRAARRLSSMAAGLLILTMSAAGCGSDADSQKVAGLATGIGPGAPNGAEVTAPAGGARKLGKKAPLAKTMAATRLRALKALQWLEVGQASWYGLKFQGRKTANGETYDMNGLTCAHRTLPLGSWVRVTNLKNRRSVFVRVNDRGPVPEDRVVDLSFAAAQAVGLAGTGKVKLETVRGGDSQMARDLVAQLRFPRLVGAE